MVVSPSNGMANILRELNIDAPITVVPNGVNIKKFQNVKNQNKRTELGFSFEDLLFIYSGRLAAEKNLPMVIKSFNAVAQAVDNAHLVIVGSGTVEDILKEIAMQTNAPDRIHFTGRVPYDELPEYLFMC